MKKLITLGALVLCLGLFSYGCGGGAPPAPATPPAAPEAVVGDAAPAEAAPAEEAAAPAPAE